MGDDKDEVAAAHLGKHLGDLASSGARGSILAALTAVSVSVLLLQFVHLVCPNRATGAALSRAYLMSDGDAVRVRLYLSRRLKVKAGQYIGLWIGSLQWVSGRLYKATPSP